jgi:hypothetical protein
MIIHNPILTGSFTVNGTDVASITSSAASLTSLNSYTASQNNRNGTYATTGSNTFAGIQTVNSNLVVTGSITAQTLVVQTVTSSVVYSSGSNVFGNNIANTQVFTGSMNLTGSLTVVTNGTEFQVTAAGVNIGNALTDSHVISGSLTVNPGGLFVSSSGDVGIGTITPSRYSHGGTNKFLEIVNANTSSNSQSHLLLSTRSTSAGSIGSVTFVVPNSAGSEKRAALVQSLIESNSATAVNSCLVFGTTLSGSLDERMRISSAGNVGIGTSDATHRLTMQNGTSEVGIRMTDGTNNTYFAHAATNGNFANGSIAGDAVIRGSNGISFAPNNGSSTVMRITSGGNVGIGRTTPNHQLEVYSGGGNNATTALNGGNSNTIPVIAIQSSTGSWADVINGFAYYYNTTNGNLDLYRKAGTTTENHIMTWARSNGNVGIGTTNPTLGTLQVNGTLFQATNRVNNYSSTTTSASGTTVTFGVGSSTGYGFLIDDNVNGLIIISINEPNSNVNSNSAVYIGNIMKPRGASAVVTQISKVQGSGITSFTVTNSGNDISSTATSSSASTLRTTLIFIGAGGMS